MKSPLGTLKLTYDNEHILGIDFIEKEPPQKDKYPAFVNRAFKQLEEYFAGKRDKFDIPINIEKLNATKFQKRVWKELLKIPYGETISYKELAKRAGVPNGSRAAGNANGKNPIPIIIPCHRVIYANGKLGGFSSGVWRKKKLLALETGDSHF